MQITRAVEYGAMGLICLARRAPGATVMLDEISQEEGIPASFLAKIFQNLAKAGLTRSVRGTGGGFILVREPDQISLLDVFEAIEGKIALQRCLQPTPSCERQEGCGLCGVFEQAQDQVKEVFSRTTIADLVKKHQPLRHDPRGGNVPAASAISKPTR
ncbi:MAG: Rrf2 family transcriptional regulator [Verrucomicrobia bacterium]|nr:Rrf2 family transcriptional regulator [Verrucomicrobiota bacterium]MBI3869532.1 Rrf2 family transcriptional regulator [Verrucomicrobiota bacterium]